MAGEDIVELGGSGPAWPRWPRWRPPAYVMVVAALIAAFAAGYLAGGRPGGQQARATRVSAAEQPPLIESATWCSAQTKAGLQLGTQVTNTSSVTVTLRQVKAVLPLGGLTPVAQAWAPCGVRPGPSGGPENTLTPGASAWFTITFRVGMRCPGPLPVQFVLAYEQAGRTRMLRLAGFSDLSQVSYSGCPAS
jgi:hypothetical protein